MALPLVSVCTPTWQRPFHLARCMLSVAAQDYRGPVEHVIVSDGPDPLLGTARFAQFCAQLALHHPGYTAAVHQLPAHDPGNWWGQAAKTAAFALASSGLLCELDDDDAYRPFHVRLLAAALAPGTGFAFSRMWIGPGAVGSPLTPAEESMIQGDHGFPGKWNSLRGLQTVMFRRELLAVAGLEPRTNHLELAMCRRWAAAGVPWAFVDRVTVDMYQHDDYPADGYPPEAATLLAAGG